MRFSLRRAKETIYSDVIYTHDDLKGKTHAMSAIAKKTKLGGYDIQVRTASGKRALVAHNLDLQDTFRVLVRLTNTVTVPEESHDQTPARNMLIKPGEKAPTSLHGHQIKVLGQLVSGSDSALFEKTWVAEKPASKLRTTLRCAYAAGINMAKHIAFQGHDTYTPPQP